jgi:DNA-binding XRE family transcriptional regulator
LIEADIPKRFKALRRKAGITQKRLGNILGVSRSCINEIENRRAMPHLFTTWERFTELEDRHRQARKIRWPLHDVRKFAHLR